MKILSPSLNLFLNSNQAFKYTTFESALTDYINENKEFPELNDDVDIPKICRGIIEFYRHLFSTKNNHYEKRFVISKLNYFQSKIEARDFIIWHYVSVPGFDSSFFTLLFQSLWENINLLISEFEGKVEQGNIEYEPVQRFSYCEVASMIHLLSKSGFIRKEITNKVIAENFYFLTGFKADTLNNKLSENAFKKDPSMLTAKKTLRNKLLDMLESLS